MITAAVRLLSHPVRTRALRYTALLTRTRARVPVDDTRI
jgi:hypothetical protein